MNALSLGVTKKCSTYLRGYAPAWNVDASTELWRNRAGVSVVTDSFRQNSFNPCDGSFFTIRQRVASVIVCLRHVASQWMCLLRETQDPVPVRLWRASVSWYNSCRTVLSTHTMGAHTAPMSRHEIESVSSTSGADSLHEFVRVLAECLCTEVRHYSRVGERVYRASHNSS